MAELDSTLRKNRTLSELNEKDEVTQINTLIYTMGDQAEDILNLFKLNATQLKEYKIIKDYIK